MAYKKYSEKEKAKLMAYAISTGFPNRRGSKLYASVITGLDRKTVKKWYKQVDKELLEFEIMELKSLLENEIKSVLNEMEAKRESASYRDLTVAFGIISDKLIVLEGGVTNRTENISGNWKDLIEQAKADERKQPYKPEMELKELNN